MTADLCRAIVRRLAPLGLATWAMSSSIASAEEVSVGVLTIKTLDAFEQADALTNALKRAVDESPSWQTATLDKDYALLVMIDSLGCPDPPDAACEEKIANELRVDRFMWGDMKLDGSDVIGEIHLWSRGKPSKVSPYRYPANMKTAADEALMEIVRDRVRTFDKAPVPAKVHLVVGSLDGQVLLDGQPIATLKGGVADFETTAGDHRITVKAEGYLDTESVQTLAAGATKEVSLTPIEVDSGGGSSVDAQKVLGFTGLGLGLAAAGVATYAGVRVIDINGQLDPYQKGFKDGHTFAVGQDGCDSGDGGEYPNLQPLGESETRDGIIAKCKEGSTMQALTIGMWPVAGTLAGTGIILLLTSDWSSDPESTTPPDKKTAIPLIVPSFDQNGGYVSVTQTF